MLYKCKVFPFPSYKAFLFLATRDRVRREKERNTDMVWHRERDRGEQGDKKRDRMVKQIREEKRFEGKEGNKGTKIY